MRELLDARLARFAAVGVANTLFGLACIYGCKYFLRMDDVAANAAGYAAAVMLAFVLNRNWTFRHQGPAAPALMRYLAVLAAAYAANLLAVLAARDAMGWNGYVAQLAGVLPYATVGYLGSRWFAFRVAHHEAGSIAEVAVKRSGRGRSPGSCKSPDWQP